MTKVRTLAGLSIALGMLLVLASGCPMPQQSIAKVSMLVSAGDSEKADVPIEDMRSFIVTITEISLDGPTGDGAEGEGEGEGEGEESKQAGEGEGEGEGEANKQIVFSGEEVVDLMDLTEFSLLISSEEIPAGRYTKMRISIEDPEVVLEDNDTDPENDVVILAEDIQLTANGRLFVSQQIELPEGDNVVTLELDGLKLVEAGNSGKYVLTPQLHVTLGITAAKVVSQGVVSSAPGQPLTITFNGETVNIQLTANTEIYNNGDTEGNPTGSVNSLVFGTPIEVTGTMNEDGSITAERILINPPTI